MMRWVMDADPHAGNHVSSTVERTDKLGFSEKVTVENGLITAKESLTGDHVHYRNYSVVNGVPLAAELDLQTGRGDRIRIKLNEPEVNILLDDAAFTPQLGGLTVLPISAIPGL
jgi:hypothetical protein